MKYSDGQCICLGDKVMTGANSEGTVVCLIEANEYSDGYPKSKWGYLGKGALINFPLHGLIHYREKLDSDIVLVERVNQ